MAWDLFLLLIGAVIALYVTVIFERRQRFGELLRDIAGARQRFEGYPLGTNDLQRAHGKAFDFWQLLEAKQWSLNADGQHNAAKEVGRLTSFAYRATAQVERMINDAGAGKPIDVRFMAFQQEFQRIKSDEFTQFEANLKPSWFALLRPVPHPVLPKKAIVSMVDYFDSLN